MRRPRRRPFFTEEEIKYLIDIVDSWIEEYPDVGKQAEDDEIESLHNDMSTAMDVRNKLWQQLNQ